MAGDLDTGAWLPLGRLAAIGAEAACLVNAACPSGRYRDLARPAVLLLHCNGAIGLGFGTVVISGTDTETEAAADPTAAALRVTCCVMIIRTRERGWSRVCRAAGCRAS